MVYFGLKIAREKHVAGQPMGNEHTNHVSAKSIKFCSLGLEDVDQMLTFDPYSRGRAINIWHPDVAVLGKSIKFCP